MDFEILEQGDKGKQRGQDTSMRSLVNKNTEMMHKVGSRLGDLNVLKATLEQAIMLLESHKQEISNDVQKISNKVGFVETAIVGKISSLETKVVGNEKAMQVLKDKMSQEIVTMEAMKGVLSNELIKIEVVVKSRLERQRYLWSGVGLLVLGLVCSLGYLCFEVRELTAKMEKMQLNVENRMVEKKNILTNGVNKGIEVKPGRTGKIKNR